MDTTIFTNVNTYSDDIYVGDYTECARTHSQHKGKGVVFSAYSLPDIGSLHIINPQHLSVTAVNFEKNKSVFRSASRKTISQCEGLCCTSTSGTGWVLLIELKYCKGHAIKNTSKATTQIKSTYDHLKNTLNAFDNSDTIYCVISMPDLSNWQPHQNFINSQPGLVKLKKSGVVCYVGVNELEIISDSVLMAP